VETNVIIDLRMTSRGAKVRVVHEHKNGQSRHNNWYSVLRLRLWRKETHDEIRGPDMVGSTYRHHIIQAVVAIRRRASILLIAYGHPASN